MSLHRAKNLMALPAPLIPKGCPSRRQNLDKLNTHQKRFMLHLSGKSLMYNFRFIFFFSSVLSLFACNTRPSVQTQLVNHWEMASILQNGQDVSEQHNPKNNRWIDLQSDGTFISDGDPYGRNTGKWTINQQNMELFLDSDVGEGDDSYWIVEIKEDQVFLKGTRSNFTEQFGMVWRKGE